MFEKRKRSRRTGINIADSGALSDLAFLLIVFFIVIAVFNINIGFLLSLPQKDKTRIVNRSDLFRIELSDTGGVSLNGEQLSDDGVLKEKIETQLRQRPNTVLLLNIDPETPYQRVVDIIDLSRETNVDNFSFKMAEPEGAS